MTEDARPRRLIEVDLPIARISTHARREKSIRQGHISTLHMWWARRPLGSCRAVILAALCPDPADPLCPKTYVAEVSRLMKSFRDRLGGRKRDLSDSRDLRAALIDFTADFAQWENSNEPAFVSTARALIKAGHDVLGGGTGRPLVADPFAGGGSIPLEALRLGADAFASDLNPIPVLLNRIALEYIPRFGRALADEIGKWGDWIGTEAERELSKFYPSSKGETPIAYLWARTIVCEGADCGLELPLLRSLWLAKKGNRSVAMRLIPKPRSKRIDIEIVEGARSSEVGQGTSRRGSATCPACGFTTPVERVRAQLSERRGGAADARLTCVVTTRTGDKGCAYRAATEQDITAVRAAEKELLVRQKRHPNPPSLVPDEPLPPEGTLGFRVQKYGIVRWGDLFTPRQSLTLSVFADLVRRVAEKTATEGDAQLGRATSTILSMALGKLADYASSLCAWRTARSCVRGTFGRQALPITWDFGEMNPFAGSAGDWNEACASVKSFVEQVNAFKAEAPGTTAQASATAVPLPSNSVNAVVSDPPYYDAVPYADLSDYFFVWHKRSIGALHPDLFSDQLTPKAEEAIVNPATRTEGGRKDKGYYENQMRKALCEARRILASDGIGVIVFAHKSTSGWEAMIQSILDAGWIATASWPIDTERPGRLRAHDSAALASSVHLVCRPRTSDSVGEWRTVLDELPKRIHEWMPRLASEGVVGADAIFACLGPALEVYSRYQRVEKGSGEIVPLSEYLEQVWATVAREALSMIFAGADASDLEADARLTAMWLWTLSTRANGDQGASDESDDDADEGDDDARSAKAASAGFSLEYDTARKIAQSFGARLEDLTSVVEIRGEAAILLPVGERARHLFAKTTKTTPAKAARKRAAQTTLFDALEAEAEAVTWGEEGSPALGASVLDRVHQAMILFGSGRAEALKRFLVEEGAGGDPRFWNLSQSLSALYPPGTDEKRWVDGVLARKKGLGF